MKVFNLRQTISIAIICMLLTSVISYVAFSGGSSQNIYLDDLPASATFTIKTDDTNFWAVRDDGKQLWYSTNASYVFESVYGELTSGGSVFVTFADYTLTKEILPASNTFTFSDGATLIRSAGAGTTYLMRIEDKENVTINQLTLRYADNTQGTHRLLRIKNSNNIKVQDVELQNSSAYMLSLIGNCNNIHIERCDFTGVQDTAGTNNIGVWADNGKAPTDVWVSNCYFYTRGAIWIDTGARSLSLRWHVNFNTAINVTGDVFGVYSAHQSEIIGNTILWNRDTNIMNGIDIQNASGTTISSNTLKRYANDTTPANPNVGIFVGHGALDSVVDANTVFNCTTGIILYGASNSSVTDNIIWECSSNGININDDGTYNADQNLLEGNHVRDCDYGIYEQSTADYNMIVGCYALGCTTINISVSGANTECHICFNGTSWISQKCEKCDTKNYSLRS